MDNISGSNPEAASSSLARPALPTPYDFGILYFRMVLGWDWDKISGYTSEGCQELKPRYEKALNYVMGL